MGMQLSYIAANKDMMSKYGQMGMQLSCIAANKDMMSKIWTNGYAIIIYSSK